MKIGCRDDIRFFIYIHFDFPCDYITFALRNAMFRFLSLLEQCVGFEGKEQR